MTDHQRILEWLKNGDWRCSTELDFMRDARKRISELIKSGVKIDGIPCDGRCGKIHKNKNLKMRKLLSSPTTCNSTLANFNEAPKDKELYPKREFEASRGQKPLFSFNFTYHSLPRDI